MKKMIAAILFTVAIPATVHAQATPAAPSPAKDCCPDEKKMPCCEGEKKMACCEKMTASEHAGHGKQAGAPDPHAGHDMSQHGGHKGDQQPQ